eukprot:1426278-Amphidinium_carterae.1
MKSRKLEPPDMFESDVTSSRSIIYTVLMNTHGGAWNLSRPATTPGCLGLSRCPGANGKGAVGETLISAMTKACTALGEGWSRAVSVSGPAAYGFPLRSAVVVATGRVSGVETSEIL